MGRGEQRVNRTLRINTARLIRWRSADGDLLVTGAGDGSLKVRDLSSGDVLLSERRSRGQYNTAAFSPDGSLLALGIPTAR